MSNDLVSIIMPSYNTARFIAESINSVLNQTYRNWELIIVDDCSTDDTDDVVAEFNDERIIYIKNEKNLGAALSRNIALKTARGKWIAFLDSDDLWHPEKLEKQINYMEKNGFYFSYTNYETIDEMSQPEGKMVTGPLVVNKRKLYDFNWLGCLTVMYDAEYVGIVQIADLKKRNDYAIWLKIIQKTPCYLLEENLAKYRIRKGSISRQSKLKLIRYHYILFRKGEKRSAVSSVLLTGRNLFWGVLKRIIYKERKTV